MHTQRIDVLGLILNDRRVYIENLMHKHILVQIQRLQLLLLKSVFDLLVRLADLVEQLIVARLVLFCG